MKSYHLTTKNLQVFFVGNKWLCVDDNCSTAAALHCPLMQPPSLGVIVS